MLDVMGAAERIRSYVHNTPIAQSRQLNALLGKKVYLKCEHLQRGGAFKARGAFNFLLRMTPDLRGRGVVAFSSGNHAQAVALAARELGARATIVMPDDAPRAKVAATRGYGADVHFYDRHHGDREKLARDLAAGTGATIVPPFDHEWTAEGAGTAALELLEQAPDIDTLVAPMGGGGLCSGSIIAAAHLKPSVLVYGVEPELANDWQQSLQAGERVKIAPPETIADGLRTLAPGVITFPIVHQHATPVLTVSEDQIKAAMRFLLTRMKLVVEASGAVGVAAALAGRLPSQSKAVGIILSGGNVDLQALATICAEANPGE